MCERSERARGGVHIAECGRVPRALRRGAPAARRGGRARAAHRPLSHGPPRRARHHLSSVARLHEVRSFETDYLLVYAPESQSHELWHAKTTQSTGFVCSNAQLEELLCRLPGVVRKAEPGRPAAAHSHTTAALQRHLRVRARAAHLTASDARGAGTAARIPRIARASSTLSAH